MSKASDRRNFRVRHTPPFIRMFETTRHRTRRNAPRDARDEVAMRRDAPSGSGRNANLRNRNAYLSHCCTHGIPVCARITEQRGLRVHLAANVLHATTIGQGDASDSHASVADLSLTVGGNTVSSSLIVARALARCMGRTPQDPPVSGSSEIVALTVNGAQIAVSGQPNQTIFLPNGQVVINE